MLVCFAKCGINKQSINQIHTKYGRYITVTAMQCNEHTTTHIAMSAIITVNAKFDYLHKLRNLVETDCGMSECDKMAAVMMSACIH